MFYKFGERGSGFRQKSTSAIQDYDEIRKKCLHLGELFQDPAFPAANESLFYTAQRGGPKFEWKRPHELIENPRFFVEDASRFDIKQGELGDCWLLAAIANLTLHEPLFHRVVPPNQSFRESYAGIFHFRFWQYGKWVDICIDDRLPTVNGHLMFLHSQSRQEFWSALLEKAYAKLHGSYEALKGGSFGEAVEDFTGGIAEFYDLQSKECPSDLYNLMKKAHERNSFMGCSINALSPEDTNKKLSNGLVQGHAYSITGMSEVELSTSRVKGKIPLVRIRNPWGNDTEWTGAWSDGSREWTIVSDREKAKIELKFNHDGEFWMSYQDFKSNFTNLEICNLSPAPLSDEEHNGNEGEEHSHCNKHWEESIFEGSWISGVSAGGCRNFLQTYAMNPQYLVTLVDHDEDDQHDKCTLIIALMQKNHRVKRKMGVDTLTIGFAVYEVKHHFANATDEPLAKAGFVRRQLLDTDFFKYNASVARSPNFINLREVTLRVKLPPGQYCIIPSTYEPGYEGDFLLRIFTEKKPKECCENDNEVGIITDPNPEIDKENEIDNDPLPNGYQSDDDQMHDRQPHEPYRREKDPDPDTISRFGDFLASCCTLLVSCINTLNTVNENVSEKVHFDSLDAKNQSTDYRTAPASVQNFFAKIAGEDAEVDAEELQQILNYALKKVLWPKYKFDGFSLESCRSMVAMLDDDRSGKLGIDEFTLLWRYIKAWCEVFKKHDKDGNQMMNSAELRNALLDAKMSANRIVLQTLILRYGQIIGKKGDLRVERSLTFDAFILCCIKLKHIIDIWSAEMSQQAVNSNNDQDIKLPTFTLDKFIETVMYS